MYKKLRGGIAVLLLLLSSCKGLTPHIEVVCEEDKTGNDVIKWETTPAIDGEVSVYASYDPNLIPENHPVASGPISQLRLTIPRKDTIHRSYYTLVFNNEHRAHTATRNIRIPGIQNFRDIGGYPSIRTKKMVRWGMVYRSARIDSLPPLSRAELEALGIRTIIDFDTPEDKDAVVALPAHIKRINIPISVAKLKTILTDIQDGSMASDTVYRLVERMNRELISRHTADYSRMFHILLDKENYPVLLQCSTGKGRTGIATALLLHVLGVNEDLIMNDYKLSNAYFDIPAATRYVYQMPVPIQEAVTTILSAKENFLNAAKDEVERRYGDVDIYIQKGIGLDDNQIKQLQSILLH